MEIQFAEVTSEDQVKQLAELASFIWHECYAELLISEQIGYMVQVFQSENAIFQAIEHKDYHYFFIMHDDQPVGYMAIQPKQEKLFLSKLYLKKDMRGRDVAKKSLDFIEVYARERGLQLIWLTVNKGNERATGFYQKMGFITKREQIVDIGNGFVMNDYIMVKDLI